MIKNLYQQVKKVQGLLPSFKKVAGFFKIELGGKIIKEFCALIAKTYAYLLDDDSEKKKTPKEQKKCIIKKKILCLKITKIVYLLIKSYEISNKYLEVTIMIYALWKSIRLR